MDGPSNGRSELVPVFVFLLIPVLEKLRQAR